MLAEEQKMELVACPDIRLISYGNQGLQKRSTTASTLDEDPRLGRKPHLGELLMNQSKNHNSQRERKVIEQPKRS